MREPRPFLPPEILRVDGRWLILRRYERRSVTASCRYRTASLAGDAERHEGEFSANSMPLDGPKSGAARTSIRLGSGEGMAAVPYPIVHRMRKAIPLPMTDALVTAYRAANDMIHHPRRWRPGKGLPMALSARSPRLRLNTGAIGMPSQYTARLAAHIVMAAPGRHRLV